MRPGNLLSVSKTTRISTHAWGPVQRPLVYLGANAIQRCSLRSRVYDKLKARRASASALRHQDPQSKELPLRPNRCSVNIPIKSRPILRKHPRRCWWFAFSVDPHRRGCLRRIVPIKSRPILRKHPRRCWWFAFSVTFARLLIGWLNARGTVDAGPLEGLRVRPVPSSTR